MTSPVKTLAGNPVTTDGPPVLQSMIPQKRSRLYHVSGIFTGAKLRRDEIYFAGADSPP